MPITVFSLTPGLDKGATLPGRVESAIPVDENSGVRSAAPAGEQAESGLRCCAQAPDRVCGWPNLQG